jgi:predicted nuclease of predicted toxin-antitoxin system
VKFIVDAQLPKSLSDFLLLKEYDCIHTLDLPNGNATTDNEVMAFSKKGNRVVITKDNDFLESFMINKQPEKLIIVKTGNIRNTELIEMFNKHIDTIVKLLSDNSLVEITKTEIVVHA